MFELVNHHRFEIWNKKIRKEKWKRNKEIKKKKKKENSICCRLFFFLSFYELPKQQQRNIRDRISSNESRTKIDQTKLDWTCNKSTFYWRLIHSNKFFIKFKRCNKLIFVWINAFLSTSSLLLENNFFSFVSITSV